MTGALCVGTFWVKGLENGEKLSLSLTFGALFGVVLQRSRFCFFCLWRDWLDHCDPRGLLGIIAALAVGIAGYTVLFGAWMPDPFGSRLPPDAHIGPVGPVLVLAGLAFGAGMAVSGSCLSAHLYRLGEGSPTAPFALAGSGIGFGIGFLTWNSLYLASVSDSPVLWLPRWIGYGGSLVLSLGLLAAAAVWLLQSLPPAQEVMPRPSVREAVFVRRWPTWLGGLAVGALGMVAYLRVSPLGVTSEIGARSREVANALGILPQRLEGLDGFRGCATVIRDALFTPNGMFITGLILASLAAAIAAGQFKPARPSAGQIGRGLLGGILLGWGAMTGLGCSIGTFLSGIMAGAISGWVFGITMFAGVTVTLLLGRRLGVLTP
jgi:uncharacterized membrane protein YedE/YeeE